MGLVQIEIPSGRQENGTPRKNGRFQRQQSSSSDGYDVTSPLSSPDFPRERPSEGAITEMDGGVVVYTWGDIVVTEVSPSPADECDASTDEHLSPVLNDHGISAADVASTRMHKILPASYDFQM